jgi:hypothetical protein
MGKMRRVSPDEQVRLLPTLNRVDGAEHPGLKRVVSRLEVGGGAMVSLIDACTETAVGFRRRTTLTSLPTGPLNPEQYAEA